MRIAQLCAIALTPFLLSAAMPQRNAPQESAENPECLSPFHVMHAGIRHTESKGVGYKDGYTTLEWFGIYQNNSNFMPFLDLRGHVFNDGKLAGNVGLGERTVMSSINHIFGLYLYYDVRQDEHGLTVNQLSPGLEILGKRMEYRINGYFPVGKDESRGYERRFGTFSGNRILLKENKRYAMTGGDAEVGAHITQSTRHDFYFGVGPYYFTADPFSAWGGKARLYWRYQQYVGLEASYSYDHLFKNVVQGTISFNYPFGTKLHRKGQNCPNANDLALSRAAFAPYRFEIPVVRRGHRHFRAINPATGQPWRVWFVRNTSSSDGTFESPFPTLAQAQNASGPNDMIYVFLGDGTSRGMNAGITLQNGQKLFGAGTVQHINTTKGRIRIPTHSPNAPTITNSLVNGSTILLASDNEISGMNIVVTGTGIDGNLGSHNNINIHNNMFVAISTGATGDGISTICSGNVRVTNNQFFTVGPLPTGAGIEPLTLAMNGPTNMTVANNVIKGGGTHSIRVSNIGANATFSSNVNITNNVISDAEGTAMVRVQLGLPNSVYRIANNRITLNRSAIGDGIRLDLNNSNGSGTFFIDNNTILATLTDVQSDCILVQTTAPTSGRVSITNNTVLVSQSAASTGLNINVGSNPFCATITNNVVTLQNPTTQGIVLSGTINVDNFSNNIAPNASVSGGVNFVAPNTCGL